MAICAATNHNTQLTMMQQRLVCALKNGWLFLGGCCCLIDRVMRSSSESISHRHLEQSLDWKWQANGLASKVTQPYTTWGHIKALIDTLPVD
jgi:hypothetical protein